MSKKKKKKKNRNSLALSGKYNPGSLKNKILKGDFTQASDLVKVPEEKLAEYLKNELGFT